MVEKYLLLKKLQGFYEKIQKTKLTKLIQIAAAQFHFMPEKVKVNADFYVNDLLPKLIEDCESLLPNSFVFQQDGAPAHSSRLAQESIEQHSPEFVKKDDWPPNSPDLNPLDYHVWGAMLERYKVFTPKPTNKAELKAVLEAIWEDLPQEAIDLAVLAFRKRLQVCIRAYGGHFEHLLK